MSVSIPSETCHVKRHLVAHGKLNLHHSVMGIGNRIAGARRRKEWSQTELADAVGVSKNSVSSWETGGSPPRDTRVRQIARALGVTEAYLRGFSDNVQSGPESIGQRVPLISNAQAGGFAEAVEIFEPGDAEDWVTPMVNVGPSTFALRVCGDSMISYSGERSYPPGSIIIVDPDVSPDPGRRVIARRHSDGEVTFKELAYDAGIYYLKPLNRMYDPIKIDGVWSIVGVVVGSWMPE